MTRLFPAALGILALVLAACSSQPAAHHRAASSAAPPMLLEGLGRHHQTVSTTSPEAQAYFDQGLRLVYGFNHIEAERAFREATRLDPECAMCYWGIALTQGSNYNSPTDVEREKAAFAAIQQAVTLAGRVTPRERATIEALAMRHAATPPGDRAALALPSPAAGEREAADGQPAAGSCGTQQRPSAIRGRCRAVISVS